jgi:uncharacterized damage-inducible protein DinB
MMEVLNIAEIENKINLAFEQTIKWIDRHSENEINKKIYSDKWTAAGHIFHLIKSTKAVSQAMKKPKVLLRWSFGTNNRIEKSFDQLKDKYNSVLKKSTTNAPVAYSAKEGRQFNKSELIARMRHEQDQLINTTTKWNEKQLSKYIVPHPALGKLTIREVLYFTVFHTEHHQNILKDKYALEKEHQCQ